MKALRHIALFCMILLLAACSRTAQTEYTPHQMAEAILRSQEGAPAMRSLLPGDEEYAAYLADYYHIDGEMLSDGAICYAGGTEASEIAVFALADGVDAAAVEEALRTYIDNRTGDFVGYLPEQAALLKGSGVAVNGDYVTLLICGDAQGAREAFLACFGADAEVPAVAVGAAGGAEASGAGDDEPVLETAGPAYDHEAIVAAWKTGERNGLSENDRQILEACEAVMDEVLAEGMSDYEKELAIHDRIVGWTRYDEGAISHSPDEPPDPDNDNPYGPLLHQKATCLGYSRTFQLFMDLLEIECITVEGTAHDGEADHAWNMVRLDGEWYCVDLTWDDPDMEDYPNDTALHDYFNVTSGFLRENDHQWNSDGVPEATATAHRYPED